MGVIKVETWNRTEYFLEDLLDKFLGENEGMLAFHTDQFLLWLRRYGGLYQLVEGPAGMTKFKLSDYEIEMLLGQLMSRRLRWIFSNKTEIYGVVRKGWTFLADTADAMPWLGPLKSFVDLECIQGEGMPLTTFLNVLLARWDTDKTPAPTANQVGIGLRILGYQIKDKYVIGLKTKS